MSARIAEFESSADAMAFMRLKNKDSDSYTVVAGTHMLYAVMPKIHYFTDLGDPFGPPERVPVSGCDPDLDE